MVLTETTYCQISEPKAPAFIARAPPTLPGIALKNSAPYFKLTWENLDNFAREVPAPESIKSFEISRLLKFLVCMVVPSKPLSLTKRLLPRPTNKSCVLLFFKKLDKAASSSGTKNWLVWPPVLKEQCYTIGSFNLIIFI